MPYELLNKQILNSIIHDLHEYSSDVRLYEFMQELSPHENIHETRQYFEALLSNPNKKIFVIFVGSKAVGTASIDFFDDKRKTASFGLAISQNFWGNTGVIVDIADLISYAFSELGVRRMEAITELGNVRSQNLVEFLGFVREGVKRAYYYSSEKNISIDAVIYGALKSDLRDL